MFSCQRPLALIFASICIGAMLIGCHSPTTSTDSGTSLTGLVLYSARGDGQGETGIWLLDLKTGVRTQIVSGPASNLEMSPDGEWLAFEKPEPQSTEKQARYALWIVSRRDSTPRQVSESANRVDWRWLPDSSLYYTLYPEYKYASKDGRVAPSMGGIVESLVFDPRTGKQVTGPSSWRSHPSLGCIRWFSPTEPGQYVERCVGDRTVLRFIDLDLGVSELIYEGLSLPSHPVWSPCGDRVAWTLREELRLWYVEQASLSTVLQTDAEHGGYRALTWSSDGRRLAYIRDPGYSYCILDVQSGDSQCCCQGAVSEAGPDVIAWLPNSMTILVSTNRGHVLLGDDTDDDRTWDIYAIDVERGEIIRLTHDPLWEREPIWFAE